MMLAPSSRSSARLAAPPGAVAIAALVAGTIDIGAAAIINKASIIIVLQAIASGVLGKASFSAGISSAVLGLILQWLMSALIAAIFWTAASMVPLLARAPLASGAAYGVGIYVVMTYIVVPLSRARTSFPSSIQAALPDLVAMILFGMIVGAAGFLTRSR